MEREYKHLNEKDQLLISAIIKRDKKLFEVLYKQYYQQLFAIAYRYLGQVEIAEEVVHDVFITIWNKADQINVQYSMKSYLFKAVVNSALNYIKKEKADTEKRMAYLFIQDKEIVYEESAETDEVLLKSLEEALELLPAKCKQVMYLSRFGKLKQQEIALQMDISVKTVKNHLTYGFQRLREHLEKHKQLIIGLILLLNIYRL